MNFLNLVFIVYNFRFYFVVWWERTFYLYVCFRKTSINSQDESEICSVNFGSIQSKIQKINQLDCPDYVQNKFEEAAVCIQKYWRGYQIRNKNNDVQDLFKNLRALRTEQQIE